MKKKMIEEADGLDYCAVCGEVIRFMKCSNGCGDDA